MLRTLVVLLLLLAAPLAWAAVPDPAPLDTVLARHLRDGRVDYAALARDRGPLDRYLAAAAVATPEQSSRDEQIAFWVNVYNAQVLAGVLRWPTIASVLDVGQTVEPGSPGFFQRYAHVAGRERTLDQIERVDLRALGAGPRLHFVLNCASLGCPDLPPRALRASTLDSTLIAATRAFLADRTRNRVAADGALELSKLFEWYAREFQRESGGVAGFAARHGLRARTATTSTPVRILEYDWRLNRAK